MNKQDTETLNNFSIQSIDIQVILVFHCVIESIECHISSKLFQRILVEFWEYPRFGWNLLPEIITKIGADVIICALSAQIQANIFYRGKHLLLTALSKLR